jgi:hypothetical protein
MTAALRPLSSIVPSHTEPSLKNHDSRFGFRLPRLHKRDAVLPPLVAGPSNPPSDSGDSEGDTVDGFEVEGEVDSSSPSDSELELVPGQSKAHVRNSFPVNAQD